MVGAPLPPASADSTHLSPASERSFVSVGYRVATMRLTAEIRYPDSDPAAVFTMLTDRAFQERKCAAAGSLFLAIGSLVSDLALAWADPRMRRG